MKPVRVELEAKQELEAAAPSFKLGLLKASAGVPSPGGPEASPTLRGASRGSKRLRVRRSCGISSLSIRDRSGLPAGGARFRSELKRRAVELQHAFPELRCRSVADTIQ